MNVVNNKTYPAKTGWWIKDYTMDQLRILTTKVRYAAQVGGKPEHG